MCKRIDHFDRIEIRGVGHHGSVSVQWHSGNRVGLELAAFHETTEYRELLFVPLDGSSTGIQGALTVDLF